jgi:hypothetical protein
MKKQKLPAGVWTAHLPSKTKEDKQKQAEFEAYVRNSRGVFERVIQIIESYMEPPETTPVDYDCPSWAYKQADKIGYNRALKKVKGLFT